MNWKPEDDFYPGYSIIEDLGNTWEEEKKRIEKILLQNQISVNDAIIKNYMELSRDLMLFIKTYCSDEIQVFSEFLRKEKYAGSLAPVELILAQILISEILRLITTGTIKKIKNILKKFKDFLKKKIEKVETIEETEVLYKITKKIDKDGKIVENLELSIKKITIKE